jgi:hypothetical protein
MAKQKSEKVISEVTLKDPNQVIDLPRIGMVITKDNLTIERYQKLVSLSSDFEKYFNVKLTNKQNEPTEMDS